MQSRLILIAALSIANSACTTNTELTPFDFQPEAAQPNNVVQKPACGFSELSLPTDFAVFAAGAYSGRKIQFQIDLSGHEGTQIDVAVNSPNKPVVLMLGAYEPTIWNIGWSRGLRFWRYL